MQLSTARPRFPFPPQTKTLNVAHDETAKWWREQNRWPLQVAIDGARVTVSGSEYVLTPRGDGSYAASRPGGTVVAGVITEYGVRDTLTTAFFNDLSAARSALFGKSYPAPLAYEMPGNEFVHPGPCFDAHRSTRIVRTKYQLGEFSSCRCAVCHERFL